MKRLLESIRFRSVPVSWLAKSRLFTGTVLASAACFLGLAMITAISAAPAAASALRVLHSFGGGTDGAGPFSGLTRDSQGNFFGTTVGGGEFGYGTVFKRDTAGKEKVLVSFNGANGALPLSNLVQDSGDNLYGTTFIGGSLSSCGGSGCGTVFKVDPSGNETVLYAFTGAGGDGAAAALGLAQDSAGNLYGVTQEGGNAAYCTSNYVPGCGIVFKIDPSGNETILYRFTGTNGDGAAPFGGVIVDGSGNIYGTTWQGGSRKGACKNNNNNGGCGVVFKLDANGKETLLHTFTGKDGDGSGPQTQLMMDTSGNIYGTTPWGGTGRHCNQYMPGCGTVFEISANGTYKVLISFQKQNGIWPQGPLTFDGNGNLFGSVNGGGKYRHGGIFELTNAGQLLSIFSFTGDQAEPENPNGGLILDANGNIYGTTYAGGDYYAVGTGTIFEIKH